MYARSTGGETPRELTFDFASGLVEDNLLVADRETGSLWSQLAGQAVHGPLEGEPLRPVAALQTTWKHWRERHPDTRVMVLPEKAGRPYYYRDRKPGKKPPKDPPREHDPSILGLGLVVNGEAIFFPFKMLEKSGTPVFREIGGEGVTLHYDAEALTAWALDEEGELLPGVLVYRRAWTDFFPDSRIFDGKL